HLSFDFSRDRLIWDTGHQIYPHKLITGRYPQFGSIRTRGGLMGYPNPHESEFDLFMTGHAGCSVSTMLGLRAGDDLQEETDRHAVAVIGDGALPSGIVFEALNNAGGLKAMMSGGMLFEDLGFRYFGPIDGHDLPTLRRWLRDLKGQKGPILLHVLTVKGHGVPQASADPVTYHTPPVFEKVGPERTSISFKRGGSQAYTDAVSNTIFELLRDDPKVAVMTAAMCQGNKLEKIRDTYPDRFFDVGICESHAVAFAAGMAKT